MRARLVNTWLPLLLASGWALFVFWPSRGSFTGAGEDPFFNLWSAEVVWHRLARSGPLWFLRLDAWRAPIFGGAELGLALSENQLWPALLLWPVRAATGSAALALQWGGVVWTLLAAACTAGWLRSLGLRWSAGWGGLLVAASGWLQVQSVAHVQNQCLFVLPLCFWMFERLRTRPDAGRAVLFGASVGWLPGWNLYFFVFALAAIACRLPGTVRRRELPARALLLATLAALLLAAPVLRPYVALSQRLAAFGAPRIYAAGARDLVARLAWPGLFLPAADGAEPGALGPLFLLLGAAAAARPRHRGFLLGAAVALWVALGHALGAAALTTALPVVQALRAVGRATALSLLFLLPPVLALLEALPRGVGPLLLALCLVETLPRGAPPRIALGSFETGGPLAQATTGFDSLLPLPQTAAGARLQLELVAHELPLHGGLSGRWPPGHDLLQHLSRKGVDPAALAGFCGTRHLLLSTPELLAWGRAQPGAVAGRCFDEGCLFELPAAPAGHRLDLAREARWTVFPGTEPVAELRATVDGALSADALDRCRLRRTLRFGSVSFSRDQSFPDGEIEGVRFRAGDRLVRHEVRLRVFRLPAPLRPALSFETICEP